jgi:UDP-N-acetylglucosamine transferase subunit ALG13
MIFLTVGASPLPFDRLIRIMDRALGDGRIAEEVVAQIGCSRFLPRTMEYHRLLDKQAFESVMERSDAVISHAGMGSISAALDLGKPILVFPRLARYGEAVNDHQVCTAQRFAALGHVVAAYADEELVAQIGLLRDFRPSRRMAFPGDVAQRVGEFICSLLPPVDVTHYGESATDAAIEVQRRR